MISARMLMINIFLGKSAGSLVGGYLMKAFGTRPTYQIFAGATFVTGCIYFIFNKFYISKRKTNDENDICKKKKPSSLDIECKVSNIEQKKPIDDAGKELDSNKFSAKTVNKISDTMKCVSESIDGGSDSGIDNPVYSETDKTTADVKK